MFHIGTRFAVFIRENFAASELSMPAWFLVHLPEQID